MIEFSSPGALAIGLNNIMRIIDGCMKAMVEPHPVFFERLASIGIASSLNPRSLAFLFCFHSI
jgi:hypothetical protein